MVQMGDEMVIFDCDCGCEALEVSTIDLEDENTVYLSMWERGYGRNMKMGLWERLRFAFYVLRSGRNHGDQICLDRSRATALMSFLQDKLGPAVTWTTTTTTNDAIVTTDIPEADNGTT